jgi:hypothetical protein
MAAIVLGVQTGDTAAASTYATGSFTPAAGDLLLAVAGVQGTVDGGAYTSSDAGKTYAKVTEAVWTSDTRRLYAFVAEQAADADSQTGTMDVTGDAGTSCAQAILRVSGMTKLGAAAIRQFKVASNQSAADPTITFDSACLTGNPTIMVVVFNSASTGNGTDPVGWTRTADIAIGTPGCNVIAFTRNSGFTGTTITMTSGATNHAVIGIELDASASDGRTGTMAATESGADDATASGAVVVAGTFAATEAGADDATVSGAVVVSGTLAVTETGGDTFAGSGTVDGGAEPAPAQPAQPTYGAAPHTLDPRRVHAKYEEIEAIERRIRAKEEAEREKIAALEQEKRRLADLALKKRQTKTLLERRRKLEARIAAYQDEIAELRSAMAELLEEIERLQMEAELQQTVALRRRRLLLAVATAA